MGRPVVLEPTTVSERIVALDIIRALALMGVILMHVPQISGALWNHLANKAYAYSSSGRWLDCVERMLFGSKSLSTFSILFAIGLFIQFERASRRGVGTWQFARRRLGALALIGFLNYILIWESDILFTYALMGLVLTCFVGVRVRWMLIAGCVAFAFYESQPVLISLLHLNPHWASAGWWDSIPASKIHLYGLGGTWPLAVTHRLHLFFSQWNFVSQLEGMCQVLPMFLTGAWFWRKGIIRDVPGNLRVLRLIFHSTFWVGLISSALVFLPLHLIPGQWKALAQGVPFALMLDLSIYSLAVGYFTGLLLLLSKARWQRLVAPLAPMGRMALTNYLASSLLLSWIFYGHGLGCWGRTGPVRDFLVAIASFAFLAGFSNLWMIRFKYGPAEWFWRSMTYGRWEPFLNTPPPVRECLVND